MVAGVIDGSEIVVVGVGKAGPSGVAPDGDTLFEVASVTKAFTGLLLADAVQRGEVELDEKVEGALPPGVNEPAGGGEATLRDLATHYAGLPKDPDGFKLGQRWTLHQGWAAFARTRLVQTPGKGWSYSNLGFAVLGKLLAARAGKEYPDLLRDRIVTPLGLLDTVVTVDSSRTRRLATGYDRRGRPLAPTTGLESFPGASEIRSTANDLLRFISAAFGHESAPLAEAFALAASTRRPIGVLGGREGFSQGLGLEIDTQEGRPLLFHGGDRPDGFSAFIVYDPARRRGAVVLSNSKRQLADVCWRLVEPSRKLEPCGHPEPATVDVAAAAIDQYVGEYRLNDGLTLRVRRRDKTLLAQLTSGWRTMRAIGEDRFHSSEHRVTLSFLRDPSGRVQGVYFQNAGQFVKGVRQVAP